MAVTELLVKRDRFNPKQTLGNLYIDGKFECYTLEDAVREVAGQPVSSWKIPGETAIPRGRYVVRDSYSPKYRRMMPELENVDGYAGVRIHSGNKDGDTEGCILLGDIRFASYIGSSRTAVERVYKKIRAAMAAGNKVVVTIE